MSNRVGITYSDAGKAQPYAEALRQAGLEPVLLAADDSASLENLDGLLISGGADVNPSHYGQAPHPKTQKPDDPRDEVEFRLLDEALQRDIPVLAICRGLQLFNVHHGGSLTQHVEGHEARTADASQPVHDVAMVPDTKLAGILGEESCPVNSRHHQVVAEPGAGLTISARDQDGTIEGLERPDKRFAVAVQWHPEDQVGSDTRQRRLFEAFAEAVEEGTPGE